jgi:hypothetical protein
MFDFYLGSSLKQQSRGKHVTTIGHVVMIQRPSVFALTPRCHLPTEGTADINTGLELPHETTKTPAIYHKLDKGLIYLIILI